jgi:hypothetical protein
MDSDGRSWENDTVIWERGLTWGVRLGHLVEQPP